MRKLNKKIKILIVLLIAVVFTSALGVGGYLINDQMKLQEYRQQIDTAERYLNENDYESAIIAYTKAIEKNPDREEAYIGLAQIYETQGDYSQALLVLRQGYKATGSIRLYTMISRIKASDNLKPNNEGMVVGEIESEEETQEWIEGTQTLLDATKLSWNFSVINELETYSYKDYTQEYGVGEIHTDGSYLTVTYELAGLTCYYRNTSTNTGIVDTVQNIPYDTSMPEKIVVDRISRVFNGFDGMISQNSLKRLIGRDARQLDEDGKKILQFEYQNCIFTIQADNDWNITSGQAPMEIRPVNANMSSNQEQIEYGMITGKVVNAFDEPISGVAIHFFRLTDEWGSETATEISQTDSAGMFEVKLPVGEYKIIVYSSLLSEDYIDGIYTATIAKDETLVVDKWIIGVRTLGAVRIVLEWGDFPYDLDAYLGGNCNGEQVYINWRNRYNHGDMFTATLDVDVRSGYGPETITYEGNLENTELTYWVEDYEYNSCMGQSGAKVHIYWEDGSVTEITVPEDAFNVWTVFKIQNGEYILVNETS